MLYNNQRAAENPATDKILFSQNQLFSSWRMFFHVQHFTTAIINWAAMCVFFFFVCFFFIASATGLGCQVGTGSSSALLLSVDPVNLCLFYRRCVCINEKLSKSNIVSTWQIGGGGQKKEEQYKDVCKLHGLSQDRCRQLKGFTMYFCRNWERG